MNKRHILLGFEADSIDFSRKMTRILEKDNFEVEIIAVRNSKIGIKTYLEENESCDTLILREVVDRTTKFGVEDIRFILDDLPINRSINVILLCDIEYKGTELMKELYALGVMSTLFYNVTTWDIVQLIEKPRSKKLARSYYGIETGVVISTSLSNFQIEDKLRHLSDGSNKELGKRYLDCVMQMNRQQNIQFIKHVSVRNTELFNTLATTLEFDVAKRAIATSNDKEFVIIDIKVDTELNKKKLVDKSANKRKKSNIFSWLFRKKKSDNNFLDEDKLEQYADIDIIEPVKVEPTIVEEIYAAVDVKSIEDFMDEEDVKSINPDREGMCISERKVIYEQKVENTSKYKEPDESTCKRLLQFI